MEIDIIQLAQGIRSFLKNFDPLNPTEAAAYLELLSAMKEEREEKRLKTTAYAVLESAAPAGSFDFNGIIIDKVQQTKTVYNRTGEVVQAEAQLAQAKKALETAQRAAGFETVPGNVYWQVRKVVPEGTPVGEF